ncbi:MAG: GspH/FimT family pseudopilin [Halofilum sp. (in: g-proteobacteria)]|nr:GspH/FimT family pseudopilin [Halofilum sp. (in: g-proteobacteria)]
MNKRAGFTIVELVVTLAVVAIVVTVAIPSFASFMRSQRATTQANDLLVSLTFARSEALKRGEPIAVCATDDANAAPPACAGDDDWSDGWLVFVDDDAAGTDGDFDSGSEELLRVHNALDGNTALSGTGSSSLRFLPDGLVAAAADFTLEPQGCTNDQQRAIDVTATGRAEVRSEACS